eukprot:4107227-Pyramimonas_sp.AAC.1
MAGNRWNRFQDIRRVRLRIESSELCLLPELGPRRNCIVRVIFRSAVDFLHLTGAVGGCRAGNQGIDSETEARPPVA